MKWIWTACIFTLLSGPIHCQDFLKFYQDSAEIQTARHILPDKGNKLWLGGTKGNSGENTKAWLYRLDSDGNVLKKISFPGIKSQVWVGMEFDPLGVLVAVIGLQEFTGETNYYLAKCDSTGLLAFSPISGLENAVLDDVSACSRNRILVCGFKSSPGIAGNDFFLARVNLDSSKTDLIFYEGFGPNDHISMVQETTNGSILFCGTVADGQSYSPCMGKIDSLGTTEWLTIPPTQWNDGAQKFTLDPDGNIWLVGESSTSAGPFFDTELFKFNSSGELIWQQWLGSPGQDAAFNIRPCKLSSGFWVSGYSNAGGSGNGPISPFLMRLDSAGNSLGESFWPMSAPSPVYDIEVFADSTFYFCGISSNKGYFMRRNNPTLQNTFVVKNGSILFPEMENSGIDKLKSAIESGKVSRFYLSDITGKQLAVLNFQDGEIRFPSALCGSYLISWQEESVRKSILVCISSN
jgi:hypothetical protein